MGIRELVGLLCLAGVAAAAWWQREALGLAPLGRLMPLAAEAPAASAAGLRKCMVGGQLLYTNGNCPAGSREQAIQGGSVSVVASPRAVPAPAPAASRLPHVRDLLLDPQGADLEDRRMDAVIGP
jgi:hypothetical protein